MPRRKLDLGTILKPRPPLVKQILVQQTQLGISPTYNDLWGILQPGWDDFGMWHHYHESYNNKWKRIWQISHESKSFVLFYQNNWSLTSIKSHFLSLYSTSRREINRLYFIYITNITMKLYVKNPFWSDFENSDLPRIVCLSWALWLLAKHKSKHLYLSVFLSLESSLPMIV